MAVPSEIEKAIQELQSDITTLGNSLTEWDQFSQNYEGSRKYREMEIGWCCRPRRLNRSSRKKRSPANQFVLILGIGRRRRSLTSRARRVDVLLMS